MSGNGREREFQAWLDGELGPWARRRAARRAARDPRMQAEADFWREVGTLLREEAAETPAPDLWPALRDRLPQAPPATRQEPVGFGRPRLAWLSGAGVAAAAAVALAVGLFGGDAGPGPGSLRWLDTEGKPAMVLQDDREATIIWLLEGPAEQSARRTPRAIA